MKNMPAKTISSKISHEEYLIKGSFTVEAALVFPVILIVIFSVIYLNAHIHNRSYLEIKACEISVSGKEAPPLSLFAMKECSMSVTESDNSRNVSVSASTEGVFRFLNFKLKKDCTYEKCSPSVFVKKYQLLSTALKQ